jgi:hypothetical protein
MVVSLSGRGGKSMDTAAQCWLKNFGLMGEES